MSLALILELLMLSALESVIDSELVDVLEFEFYRPKVFLEAQPVVLYSVL